MTNIDLVTQKWHEVVETKNIDLLDDLLADNAILVSPVVHTPQVGKKITKKYLIAAMHVFSNESFKYVRELKDDSSVVLEFETMIGDVYVNGVDMIRANERGQIEEFRVMVRPLQGLQLIHKMMFENLEKSSD
jgi:hypothetical protein